ncbi:MAG: SMP-30/gluconolactonase/LRE family protein [Candidatus Poribacteria bacterium]|nr:SMP-30/gluconolactonase/LRE family protein [Candidatus Poribacteria bacterium]
MSWDFELVEGPFNFTEGPAWDGEAILFTDIPNNRIMRYDPRGGECTEFRTGTNEANGLMFDQAGQLYACEGGGRRIVRYDSDGGTAVIVNSFEGKRLNSPNDLAFDAQGRLWFTDPRYGERTDDLELEHQSVFRLDPQADGTWEISRVTYDTTKPNGLLISPDGGWLYVAQSEYGEDKKRELRGYPINDDGTVGEYEVLHNFHPHRGIDGMCLDTEGNIVATAGWQESGPGPMIYVFAPNGRVLETHPIPTDRPTNCTFGDADRQTLYVTAGGCLYRARTERTGYLIYPQK